MLIRLCKGVVGRALVGSGDGPRVGPRRRPGRSPGVVETGGGNVAGAAGGSGAAAAGAAARKARKASGMRVPDSVALIAPYARQLNRLRAGARDPPAFDARKKAGRSRPPLRRRNMPLPLRARLKTFEATQDSI